MLWARLCFSQVLDWGPYFLSSYWSDLWPVGSFHSPPDNRHYGNWLPSEQAVKIMEETSEIAYHHFQHILVVVQTNPDVNCEWTTLGVTPRGQGSLWVILEAGLH